MLVVHGPEQLGKCHRIRAGCDCCVRAGGGFYGAGAAGELVAEGDRRGQFGRRHFVGSGDAGAGLDCSGGIPLKLRWKSVGKCVGIEDK